MTSTSNKIIIVFETNNLVKSEDIKSSLSLKRKYADIYTLEEIQTNQKILLEYTYLLDCTFDNKIFSNFKNNKKGIIIKEDYEYIKTPTNKIILNGPNISQLTIAKYSNDSKILNKFEETINEYNKKILFLTKKDPVYNNIQNFEKGVEKGIIFNEFVNNAKTDKIYKLVLKIPKEKEPNVIYVTVSDIEVLHKLIEVSNAIIF